MRISSRPRTAAATAVALLLSLSACDNSSHTISGDDADDQKEAVAHAKPVELPPSIQASKSYRCKDNSVVFIDWFSGDKQAGVKTKKDGTETMLKADAPGTEKTAEGGYALTGTAAAPSIDLTLPGKGKQSCKG